MAVYKLEIEKLAKSQRKRFFRNYDLLRGDYYIIGGEQPASPEEDLEKKGDLTVISLVEDGQFLHYDRPKTDDGREFYFRRKIEFGDVIKFFAGMDLTPVNKAPAKKKEAEETTEDTEQEATPTKKKAKKATTAEKSAPKVAEEKKTKTAKKTAAGNKKEKTAKEAAKPTAVASKLSDKKIAEIKKCRAKGMTIKATAEKVGVSESTVRKYGKE